MKVITLIRSFSAALVHQFYLETALFVVGIAGLSFWGFPVIYSVGFGALYLIIVISFNSRFVGTGIKRGIGDVRQDYLLLGVVVICTTLWIWGIPFENLVFLGMFVCFLLYEWDSRIVAVGACIALVLCPVFVVAQQQASAEQMAVYAYYFLAMTVALQIIEHKQHLKSPSADTKYV